MWHSMISGVIAGLGGEGVEQLAGGAVQNHLNEDQQAAAHRRRIDQG